MHDCAQPCRVIDLAEYRARRVARASTAPPARYVLWYPGVGFFGPHPPRSAQRDSERGFAAERFERRP